MNRKYKTIAVLPETKEVLERLKVRLYQVNIIKGKSGGVPSLNDVIVFLINFFVKNVKKRRYESKAVR